MKTCHDRLQLPHLRRLLHLHHFLGKASYEEEISKAQGHAKEQAAKGKFIEDRAKDAAKDIIIPRLYFCIQESYMIFSPCLFFPTGFLGWSFSEMHTYDF